MKNQIRAKTANINISPSQQRFKNTKYPVQNEKSKPRMRP